MTDPSAMEPEAPKGYERPTLIVVGNLRDLLAGSGSKFIDDQSCTAANGLDTSC